MPIQPLAVRTVGCPNLESPGGTAAAFDGNRVSSVVVASMNEVVNRMLEAFTQDIYKPVIGGRS